MSQCRWKCGRQYWPPHLIGVVDSDFQPPEYLPLRRMLIHGQLKHVLRAVLSVESGGIVVQVHHTDHQCGHPVVHKSAFRTYFRGLDQRLGAGCTGQTTFSQTAGFLPISLCELQLTLTLMLKTSLFRYLEGVSSVMQPVVLFMLKIPSSPGETNNRLTNLQTITRLSFKWSAYHPQRNSGLDSGFPHLHLWQEQWIFLIPAEKIIGMFFILYH